jgi:hypothetical protein
VVGDLAAVGDSTLLICPGASCVATLPSVWAQAGKTALARARSRGDRGSIHRGRRRAALQHGDHLLGDFDRNIDLALPGCLPRGAVWPPRAGASRAGCRPRAPLRRRRGRRPRCGRRRAPRRAAASSTMPPRAQFTIQLWASSSRALSRR